MIKKTGWLPLSALCLCLLSGLLAGNAKKPVQAVASENSSAAENNMEVSENLEAEAQGKVVEIEKQVLGERFLKADGKVLRNHAGKGQVVVLRGTNIGGWQVMESWMCPTNSPDQRTTIATLTERFGKERAEELLHTYESTWIQEQDFDNLRELNFNVVRLPISYFNLLDEEGKLRKDTLASYDWFVEECEKRDIYVILDLHAAPGSQNGRDHSGDTSGSTLFTDEKAQELTISLWQQLAEHYKGNSTIAGYDLLNEAEGNEQERAPWGKVQLPFFDRLYQAIRSIDPDHIILLNAVWAPGDMPDPSVYGWENVIYEYHYYCWNGTDNPVTQRNFINEAVKNDAKAGFDVPVLIGEFTLFDKLQSWEYALRTFEEHGWSWTTWTYKTVDRGNWGIYNSTESTTPKVNIYLDSAETIKEKWSRLGTAESFKKNKYLFDLLRTFASADTGETANGQKTALCYQNFEYEEPKLRAGRDAVAEMVSAKEATHADKDSKAVKLTISGAEQMPSASSRNICIPPAIRNSVDTSGLDYLTFDTYVRTGNRSLQVTLVDKDGKTWSKFTAADAMPIAYSWEKIFVDISNADIDRSAIIEIRIGANVAGEYYFDNLSFTDSYAATPTETVEEMKADLGVQGRITDWEAAAASSNGGLSTKEGLRAKALWWLYAAAGLSVLILLSLGAYAFICKIRRRR